MRVAITGGTGQIGRALAARLVAEGHEAVVLSRSAAAVPDTPGLSTRVWDASSASALVPILEGTDAVVNLAGENIGAGRWTQERKRRIRGSRVGSTTALAQAFADCSNRPRVLVQGSAVGFYGARGEEPVDEAASVGSDFLASVCQEWEEAGGGVERLGVRRVIARTGVVFAADGGALQRILLPFKLFAGGPVGSGRQMLSWIHIEDEVRALIHLLQDEGASGVFNLAAPETISNRDLARIIGRVLGRPSFFPTPGFMLRLILGEMSSLVLEGQRAVPERLLASGYEFRFPEAEAALLDLLKR